MLNGVAQWDTRIVFARDSAFMCCFIETKACAMSRSHLVGGGQIRPKLRNREDQDSKPKIPSTNMFYSDSFTFSFARIFHLTQVTQLSLGSVHSGHW